VSVSSRRSRTPAYAPADGSYRAVAAPFWRRTAASAVDWLLVFVCFLIASIPLGMVQTVAEALGGPAGDFLFWLAQALALAVVVAYFGYFLTTGHTMGMRAFDVHVFAYETGREPGLVRSSARGLLALAFFFATTNAYAYLAGHRLLPLSRFEQIRQGVAIAVALVALSGGLWKLVDHEGRTLWDRLFGLVVVEDVVPASMPDRLWSPWGT
jgi:uncharacterized RDD family membrane protein YckC